MHLTDNELMSARDGNLNHQSVEHLLECQECQQRAESLAQARHALSQLPPLTMPTDRWESIKQSHQFEQSEHALNQSKARSRFWQFSSFALAASFAGFLIALVIMNDNLPLNSLSIEQRVAHLIEENNQLQKRLKKQNHLGQYYTSTAQPFEMELSNIDSELQIAYIEGSSLEAKIELWTARKMLIEAFIEELAKKQQKSTIFI